MSNKRHKREDVIEEIYTKLRRKKHIRKDILDCSKMANEAYGRIISDLKNIYTNLNKNPKDKDIVQPEILSIFRNKTFH